jgi:PleD family two-component response regulator
VILSEAADQLRVLLVEDDRAVAEMYRYKLELDGYAVSVAGGETAIAVANESPPDLIFLEVQVPNLDAALALERLRLNDCTRDVPVVILTEHDDLELVRHGFVLGPLDHVIDTSPGGLLPDERLLQRGVFRQLAPIDGQRRNSVETRRRASVRGGRTGTGSAGEAWR